MGERLLCKQEVVGSIPSASTIHKMVSRVDDRPPDFEDRWKEPQHGNVNRDGRFAPGPVAPSHMVVPGRDHGQVKMKCK